ncbi:MAG: hypothetical protein FD157_1239 [Rhodocyclaceae bacterium]|nr:MAG: hypothetical protein FD157_1239 [Rhodocyclaceae bacterium]TND02768.1 MAG: hypothetical protein FD118_1794 [Rhodocyclaceae bacterium]
MPIVLALVASAVIHAAALLGPGWTLPGDHDADAPQTIDAVLTKPAPRAEPAPVAKSVPKPHADKPRPQRMATAASSVPAIPFAPSESSAAPAALPVEPPAAVSPAPTFEPAPVPARIALPAKGRVRYAITRGEEGFVIGQTTHTWQQDGFTYTLQSVAETTGLVALFKPARVLQSSRGEVTAAGLKPREFRHERVGGLDTASFDWARSVVAYAGREDGIAAGTQDMLSMYYQLVLLVAKGGTLEMPIATGRKLETYRAEVIGEEMVVLPAGERRASRLRIKSGNDTIELWLAVGKDADMRALPLKIRYTDRKGEIFDQVAQDIEIQEQ